MKTPIFYLIFCLLLIFSGANAQLELKQAFPNLSFSNPLGLETAPDNSSRLFVVEQNGTIKVFQNDSSVTEAATFLNISGRVLSSGGEQGLLGLAFHPDFSSNGYFYVNYTAASPQRTVVSRFTVSSTNPDSADENSELVLLQVDQPFSNHNGGQTVFGPDGYLYISFGDGGSGGDPQGNGQNLATLLGSLVRIDVNSSSGNLNYGIPPDNPFAGNSMGYREEIYAYGLRNTWRFSFDSENGRLWAADVGQSDYEEVDIIGAGKNYGWNIMEGFHCYNSGSCDTAGLELPVWEYDHQAGQSITGGYVYRGSRVPELSGKYIFGDYVSGRIWSLEYAPGSDTTVTGLLDTDLNISSFGTDQNNELFICAFNGKIYRFKPTVSGLSQNPALPRGFSLQQNYPNPFNPETRIPFLIESAGEFILTVFNLRGQKVRTLFSGYRHSGAHRIRWDGKDARGLPAPSGVYFYRLSNSEEKSATRKMLLVR